MYSTRCINWAYWQVTQSWSATVWTSQHSRRSRSRGRRCRSRSRRSRAACGKSIIDIPLYLDLLRKMNWLCILMSQSELIRNRSKSVSNVAEWTWAGPHQEKDPSTQTHSACSEVGFAPRSPRTLVCRVICQSATIWFKALQKQL